MGRITRASHEKRYGPAEEMTVRIGVLVAALAALVLTTPLADARSTMVIRLVSITTSARANDRPPKGASAGDTLFTTSRLENAVSQLGKPKGAVVGRDQGTARIVAPGQLEANGAATLPGGTIRFEGRVRALSPTSEQIPVTGGTGRFRGARGTLTVTPLSKDGVRAANVYRLTLP
jgi:hypothetical protein